MENLKKIKVFVSMKTKRPKFVQIFQIYVLTDIITLYNKMLVLRVCYHFQQYKSAMHLGGMFN